ncbi:MAG: DUF4982 domain-containing protein [Clostridia bacterium]|nr:DUF4982 domain-containing protein [Clostridia bacterium]
MRKEILLNDGWLFHKGDIVVPRPVDKGPAYSQSKTERKKIGPAAYHYHDNPDEYSSDREIKCEGWVHCDLPHDYIIHQDNDPTQNNAHGYFRYDNAWYRKHFTLPEGCDGKRVLLRFDGVGGTATVYLNGCLMDHNYSAYNTFEIDISDNVYFDKENVIALYCNTEEFEGWWYQGGGIYRDVHLTITDPVAIDLWGVYVPTQKLDESRWLVEFETTVVNSDYQPAKVWAESTIYNADGTILGAARGSGEVEVRGKGKILASCRVEDPKLWDCEAPNLYTVKTKLFLDGEEVDENTTRIGFRTVEISVDRGLLLNRKPTYINGVCAHQDFGLTGIYVPDNVAKYKVKLMKEMGANGYRTSHYQQHESYMDAFDELGFLVMDEARWFESTREGLRQLESLLKRDRNRPSVIFWSTSNEEYNHITDQGRRIHRAVAAHIRKFDKTRPITAAVDKSPDKCTIYDDCDVVGINYNLDIYDKVHEQKPNKPIFSSECCATGTIRDWNFPTNGFGRVRDKDVDTVSNWFLGREKTYKFLRSRPYVFGSFQWDAVEHRGEATWPVVCSRSGAIDLFFQKKGAFYQNKSHWSTEPMVHIVPHWNFRGMEGQLIPIQIYTNCDELELYCNGESYGRKAIELYGHGEWEIPYTPGVLEVKGYRNGELVASHVKETTGRPHTLRLTEMLSAAANGRDVALFTCECLDEAGRVIPDGAETVTFSASNPATIIGTGSDNADHNAIDNLTRKMYMGKITIAVKPAPGQKEIELFAMSENCGVTALRVNTKED